MTCGGHATETKTDARRLSIIDVRQVHDGLYHITISGQLWASVEWSGADWRIKDSINQQMEPHIHEGDVSLDGAVATAKHTIRSGAMPTPEEARRRVKERQEQGERQKQNPEILESGALIPISRTRET